MKPTYQLRLVSSLLSIRRGKGSAQLNLARGFGATSARPGAKAPTTKDPAPELVHQHQIVSPVSDIASSAAQIVVTTRETRGVDPKPDKAPILQEATPTEVPTSKALPKAKDSQISILKTFQRPSIVLRATKDDTIIQNVREVASYSWTDAKHPTIVVPGFPPIWTERKLPLELPRIPEGTPHGMQTHPLLPVVAAVSHSSRGESKKQFSLKKLDLVTDQIILARLASWVAGTSQRYRHVDTSSFSCDVQCAGKTIMLSRHNGELAALDAKVHNKRVQLAMTSQVERLIGFHRVIAYSLGGVRLLVQCETNARLLDKDGRHKSAALEWGKNHLRMIEEAGALTLSGDLRVIPAGIVVPQGRTMCFQALSEDDKYLAPHEWFMVVMRMTLGQTHHHVLGVHDQSALRRISRATLVDLHNQHDYAALGCNRRLLMLKTLLPELCATIKKQADGGPMRLVCKDGVLTLQTRDAADRDAESVLPKRVLEMFR